MNKEFNRFEKSNEKTYCQNFQDRRMRNKIANLSPYITEIEVNIFHNQRRKKIRSIKKSNKNINQSSSKSFRIKQRSVTSLHKELTGKGRQVSQALGSKLIIQKANRQRKAQSVQKNHHQHQFSKTIENNQGQKKPNHNFFNEMYVRVKQRMDKEKPARKKLYETLEQHRARSQQAGDMNLYKISTTKVNFDQKVLKKQEHRKKATQQVRNKNFRKNKYEVAFSGSTSVMEPTSIEDQKAKQLRVIVQSDSYIDLNKKQSNVSINKEMDMIAQKQMESFYHQIRTKQINRSIEKSTEKYFKQQSYRPIKSKNDIQVFISTIKAPSICKVSKSTNESNKKSNLVSSLNEIKKDSGLLDYDFDFKNEEAIDEIDNPSEEESLEFGVQADDFQRQRKKVEVEFFHKKAPHFDWSEDQCKMDDDDI